jgi:hypothetical protein
VKDELAGSIVISVDKVDINAGILQARHFLIEK